MGAHATAQPPGRGTSFGRRGALKWLVILVLGLGCLLLLYKAVEGGTQANVDFEVPGGLKLSVKSLTITSEQAQGLDRSDYFIDSGLGYAYREPFGFGWKHTITSGLAEELKYEGLPALQLGDLNDKSSFGAFMRMLADGEFRTTSVGRTLRVSFTNRTASEFLGESVPLGDLGDLLGSGINIVNGVKITVVDKLQGIPISLPTFFNLVSQGLGLELDDLVANTRKGTILGSQSATIRHVIVNGKDDNLHFDKVFLFTESAHRFYIVEATYSPETGEPPTRREAMVEVINSFKVIQ